MKNRIKEVMEYANLSQQDFAARLGISAASLSSIFTGRTNPTWVQLPEEGLGRAEEHASDLRLAQAPEPYLRTY